MTPTKIHLSKTDNQLELHFGEQQYILSAEFLRAHSPSAEVKGHGGEGGELPFGQDVQISHIEAVGNYALKISFDDNHNSGLYSWETLHHFCKAKDTLWQEYLDALHKAQKSRAPDTNVVKIQG